MMGTKFKSRTIIAIYFLFLMYPVRSQGIMGIPDIVPTDAGLKGVEILLQVYGIMLAVLGAVFTFFLTSHRSIQKLFKTKERCCSKALILLCNIFAVAGSFFVLWDLMTLSNQLRNNFVNLDDLVGGNLSWYFLCAVLLTFIPSVLILPRSET